MMRMATGVLVAATVGAIALAASAARLDLATYALTMRDVPAGLRLVAAHHLSAVDLAKQGEQDLFGGHNEGGYQLLLLDFKDSGYVDGYESDFAQSGAPKGSWNGGLIIESRVTEYSYPMGAHLMHLLGKAFAETSAKCHDLPASTHIGTEASLCLHDYTFGSKSAETFDVLWRRGRLRGSVLVGGPHGGVSAAQAMSFARLVDSRMKKQ